MNQDRATIDYNQHAWDAMVESGNRWTVPSSPEIIAAARAGNVQIVLTPTILVPNDWLGTLKQRDVLCLASGGGQQGPVLAAAGANVTVLDLSQRQLDQDRLVATRESLTIHCEQGDMRDLSRFANDQFDLIVHPVSNCFCPDILPVWRECSRVLKSGGELLAGFTNPLLYLFDPAQEKQGRLVVRYAIPFRDSDHFTPEQHREAFGNNAPFEFGHSLEDQIAGQLRAGLVLVDMFEDEQATDNPDRLPSQHFKPFIATRARKP